MGEQANDCNVLEIHGLRIEREQVILKNLDWKIGEGENWVLLGPNGSGKSSLLAAMCGFMMPSAGSVSVFGEAYGECDWMAVKERIGLVSSIVANQIEPLETAHEIVLSGMYGMINFWGRAKPSELRLAESILEEVGARHLAQRTWEQLSQGERQRVLVGRALASDCDLLFLDEPCAGLDPVARERFLEFLESIADPKRPIVLVTHHIEEIVPCFTHGLILGESGRPITQGPLSQVLRGEPLTEAFGAPVRPSRRNGRYSLRMATA